MTNSDLGLICEVSDWTAYLRGTQILVYLGICCSGAYVHTAHLLPLVYGACMVTSSVFSREIDGSVSFVPSPCFPLLLVVFESMAAGITAQEPDD